MKKYRFWALVFIACWVHAIFSQPGTFAPRGMGGGGALFFPSINPSNDNEYYVACDLSAMFHSVDFGKSYDQVHFKKLQAFNTSTYEFTKDPQIAYSNFNDGNEGYPVKTSDGGKTWSRLSAYNVSNYGSVYTLKANYNNPQQILVGAYGDILISNDGGTSFQLVRHTANNGAGIILSGVYWDGQIIYIATNEGLLVSRNGGQSFAVKNAAGLASGQVIWSFAGAREQGKIRFCCIASNSSGTYNGVMPWDYYGFSKAVYTMDDTSGVWVNRSTGINFNSDFIMYAGMAANDIDVIYLGGHDDGLSAPLVIRSVDGGKLWEKVFNTSNNANIVTAWEGYQGDKNWSWSETCFGIAVAPNNSNKLMFPTYSNVQLSEDGGKTWRQAYVDPRDEHPAGAPTPKNKSYRSIGLENTTCWQVFWQDANTMMACYSDIGGIRSTDAGKTWGYQYSGFSVNSLYRMVKGWNGNMYGACSNIHDMYQSTRLADAQLDANDSNGKIVFSGDNGQTWTNVHSFNHPVYWLAVDPKKPTTMYASVIHFGGTQGSQLGGIYRCTDVDKGSASTWTKLPNPPRTEGHPASIQVLNDGKVLCSFSGRRNSGGTFTASSGVFLYDPSVNGWKDLSDPGMLYWTKDIVIDPRDTTQNTWYACVFSGWGGAPNGLGGLYKTINRGASWSKLTASTFDRVSSISFNPMNPDQAYLTTETQGLWFSSSMDLPTPAWSLVESYPFRQPERVYFNPYDPEEVWISSFGNGMKVGTTKATRVSEGHDLDMEELVLSPNPAHGLSEIIISSDQQCKARLYVFNAMGNCVLSESLEIEKGRNKKTIYLNELEPGVYTVTLTKSTKQTCARLIVF